MESCQSALTRIGEAVIRNETPSLSIMKWNKPLMCGKCGLILVFYTLMIVAHLQCASSLSFAILKSQSANLDIGAIWASPLQASPVPWAWGGGILISLLCCVDIHSSLSRKGTIDVTLLRLLPAALILFQLSYIMWIFLDGNREQGPLRHFHRL